MLKEDIHSPAFQVTRLRQVVAQWFAVIALILLLISLVFFIWMWIQAYLIEAIPNTSWGEYGGSHGPWRHLYTLRNLWWYIAYSHFFAFNFALTSFLLECHKKYAVIAFLTLVAGFIFNYTQYWLVD